MSNDSVADLHLHTYYSDGTYSPESLTKSAKTKGLRIISVTDHDTFGSYNEVIEKGREFGVEVIPGIEISTFKNDIEVHILGYFNKIDNNTPLGKIMHKMFDARVKRTEHIVGKLIKNGVEITMEDVCDEVGKGVISRLHIANAILKKKIYAKDITDVFDKYIGFNGPAYVPRDELQAEDIIKIIKESNGVPVLAHPFLMGDDKYIKDFINAGLMGIEVFYPLHSKDAVKRYKNLANQEDLLITGGSDCHGKHKKKKYLGKIKLKMEYIDKLREKMGSI